MEIYILYNIKICYILENMLRFEKKTVKENPLSLMVSLYSKCLQLIKYFCKGEEKTHKCYVDSFLVDIRGLRYQSQTGYTPRAKTRNTSGQEAQSKLRVEIPHGSCNKSNLLSFCSLLLQWNWVCVFVSCSSFRFRSVSAAWKWWMRCVAEPS